MNKSLTTQVLISFKELVSLKLILKVLLSIVLFVAGITKLLSPESAEVYVYVLDWLPISLTLFVVEYLPLFEILVALAIWLKPIQKPAMWAMSGLYFLFFGLALYGNIMGWTMECSCFGEQFTTTFNGWMILRNGCFFIVSLIQI